MGSLLASVEQAIGGYDVVLIQGVPFGLSVEVGAIARAAGVPYVVLPHFHVEDRFYHWRAYYELFAGAAAVLSFSTGPAGALIERVGGRAAAIPGGGIDPAEFVHAGQAAELFRARHPSARPYFLVLGRKSGSKRGDLVVEAWQTRVRAALGVDLVFVGPRRRLRRRRPSPASTITGSSRAWRLSARWPARSRWSR